MAEEKKDQEQVEDKAKKELEKRKKQTKETKQALTESLGLAEPLTCFLDGKVRNAYPATLSNYGELMEYIQGVSLQDIPSNYFMDKGESLHNLIVFTFKDDDPQEILDNVAPKNFQNFIRSVLKVHGFSLDETTKEDSKNE